MSFKFLRGKEEYRLQLEPLQTISLRPQRTFENVEFCFQFDDEEAVRFATGPNDCTITLNQTPEGYMTFTNNGRVFKLFARERQDG
jgi:hypothetical protein